MHTTGIVCVCVSTLTSYYCQIHSWAQDGYLKIILDNIFYFDRYYVSVCLYVTDVTYRCKHVMELGNALFLGTIITFGQQLF